jgi:glycosyltransferase involved in cell wall biosynthesis
MANDATLPRTARSGAPGSVLHLAGPVNDAVFSFLGPATAALARQGVSQTVVLIDDPRFRHLLPKFHESVRLVLTRSHARRRDRLRALLEAYCNAARGRRPTVAHLHGMLPSLLGLYAQWFRGIAVPTYLTPHGSHALGRWRLPGSALLWQLRAGSRRLGQRAVANSRYDADTLSDLTREDVELIESPVADAFVHTPHAPSDTPLVMTSQRAANPLGAAQVAQCAVLLADTLPGLRFEWIGSGDPESVERLRAAQVRLRALDHESDRAQHLAQAWVYLAPAGGSGFPVFLAEAMALGLPCIAWDTPYHRDMIRHGDTGLLCRDTDEALAHLADLLESPDLRVRLGHSAAREARWRFDARRFSDSVLNLYAAPIAPC